LINLNAFTLFATHFDELNALSMYPAVDFHHFETKQEEGGGSRYEFTHRIVDGQRKSKDHYGLDLARASLLPVSHVGEDVSGTLQANISITTPETQKLGPVAARKDYICGIVVDFARTD